MYNSVLLSCQGLKPIIKPVFVTEEKVLYFCLTLHVEKQ